MPEPTITTSAVALWSSGAASSGAVPIHKERVFSFATFKRVLRRRNGLTRGGVPENRPESAECLRFWPFPLSRKPERGRGVSNVQPGTDDRETRAHHGRCQ